ncbi:MAG: hypothetical protein GZ085_01110 [Sulfuriferula multivorans]|uniref:Alpha-1,2-fucosyltransferase n=1 Tax=Sulfuriferula multivorans TaxID=1559896 RepID=A0A7C9KXJ8_9PROT|nr:hypothetical protein [Sulfuriferula multivorans]
MSVRKLYWQGLIDCRNYFRTIDNRLKPFYCPLQQKNNHGIYAVNITAKVGFFAQLSWCLTILEHCRRFNLTPHIVLSSPFYTRPSDDNWFEYYFENIKLTTGNRKNIEMRRISISTISDIEQLGLPSAMGTPMTIGDAKTLLDENVRIKDEIQDCVESFVAKHFAHKTVLGVHYRGTDKKAEAWPVTLEFCAQTISNYLAANPEIDALFVASDEDSFIEWIETKFTDIEVIHHDDQERSSDGKAIHVQPSLGDNYIKGKEALINCLLLSRCSALIRTASFLSAWSSIFNPVLPVIMLNQPYGEKRWFPDSMIAKNSMDQYLPNPIHHN